MRSRRGLSAVVGAAFFVIVMASTISYVAYSMNLIDDLARSVDVKQDENLNKQNEEFEITDVSITAANKFDVTIENTGNLPIKITRLYAENTTDSSWNATKIEIDTEIAPGEIKSGLVVNESLTYVGTESYLFNFITERGNIKSVAINSGGSQGIHTNLYALPDAVPTTFNTVLLYEVVNNSTGQLVNLQPTVDINTICVTCTASANENWQPAVIPSLKPGEVGSFQRSYKLTGEDNDLVSFNASLVNAYTGVWDEEIVSIQIVKESEEAGVSITAQGIGEASSFSDDVLVLHQETLTIPNGWGQLYSGKADGGTNGAIFEPDKDQHHSWFSNNSSEAITVPADDWDFVLHYRSAELPPSLSQGNQAADLIYHFETTNFPTSIVNSQGDTSRDLEPCNSGLNSPDIGTGKNNTLAYTFVAGNSDCLISSNSVTNGDKNNIDSDPDSTALWFKTSAPVGSEEQYLVNWAKDDSDSEYYRIKLLTDGKLEFEYKTNNNPNSEVRCTSVNTYDDTNWHHIVATRYDDGGDQVCRIFIDRHLNQTSCSPTCNDEIVFFRNTNNINNRVDASGNWYIGSNYTENGNFFNGVVEDLIHWNSYQVSEQESIDLAKTSYGDNAHNIQLTFLETDIDGNKQGGPLYNTQSHGIPFFDSFAGGQNDDSAYGYFNTTMVNVKALTIDIGNRVNFTVTDGVGNESWEPLDIDIKFDDEGLVAPFPTSLHAPQIPVGPFPGFNVFDRDDNMKFNFENGGIRGFFYTHAGTRMAFNATESTCNAIKANDPSDPCVYGAIVAHANGTTASFLMSPEVDSMNFPVGTTGFLDFYPARSMPSHTPGEGIQIPCGTYDGAVWVVGYDDVGESFEKTFDLSIVTFTDNNC